jgi:hypothetical protein
MHPVISTTFGPLNLRWGDESVADAALSSGWDAAAEIKLRQGLMGGRLRWSVRIHGRGQPTDLGASIPTTESCSQLFRLDLLHYPPWHS